MSGTPLGRATYELILDDSQLLRGIDATKGRVDQSVGGIEQSFAGIDKAAGTAGQSFNKIGAGAVAGSADASRALTGLASTAEVSGTRTAQSFTGARTAAGSFASSLLPIPLGFAGIGLAAAGATAGVVAFGASSIQAFSTFEAQMNEVFSLMPGATEVAMSQMSEQVKLFSADMGILTSDVIPALYESLSAGVPADNVFQFLETAQQAAVGGATDLQTAVSGISAVVNAYGSDVITAAEASDQMFTAVVAGTTTFEELSRNLADVTPLSAALGVSFGDISAALATMTVQGTRTTVATTQLRSLLVELSDSGTIAAKAFRDIAGSSFAEFIAQGNSVADALVIMQDAAAKAGVPIQEMFGRVEAGIAALSLSGSNLDAFNQNIIAVGESAGSTQRAYEQMDQGAARSFERLGAAFNLLKIETGEALAPLVADIADGLTANMPAITEAIVTATERIRDFGTELGKLPESKEFKFIVQITSGENDADTGDDALNGFVEFGNAVGDVLDGAAQKSNDAGRRINSEIVDIATNDLPALSDAFRGNFGGLDELFKNSTEAGRDWSERVAASMQSVSGASRDAYMDTVLANELTIASQYEFMQSTIDLESAGDEARVALQVQAQESQALATAAAFAADGVYTLYTSEQVLASNMSEATQAIVLQDMAVRGLAGTTGNLATAQDTLNGVAGAFSGQASQYTSDMQGLTAARDAINAKIEQGIGITAQEQTLLDQYPALYARLEGGVSDATIQEGIALTAKNDLMLAQEELNTAVANGVEDLGPYEQKLRDAEAVLQGADPNSPFKQAMEDLRSVIGDDLIATIDNLARQIDLLDGVVGEPEVTMKKDLFDIGATEVEGDMITLGSATARPTVDANKEPFDGTIAGASGRLLEFDGASGSAELQADSTSFDTRLGNANVGLTEFDGTIAVADADLSTTAFLIAMGAAEGRVVGFNEFVGTATLTVDTSAVDRAVAYADSLLPRSPAKRGPLARTPDFSYAFEPMVTAAELYGDRAAGLAASYMPMNSPADTGALSQTPNWDFLFEGMDRSAETFSADAAQRIYDFIAGLDTTALASGDLLADANAKLAGLFDGRKIAEQMNLGPEILAQFDADIAAAQAEIHAIGLAMGTPVVQGIATALANGEIAEQLAAFRLDVFSGINLDSMFANRDNLQASIVEMTALRDAALELGDVATAEKLTADIQIMNGELELSNQIIGTDAVKAWQANEEAAREATQAAQEWADTFSSITDTGGLAQLQADAREAELALKTAQLSGADPETLAILQQNYDEAVAQVIRFEAAMDTAIAAGLYNQEELIAIAAQGGESLATVLASGQLTPESIAQLAGQNAEALQTILDAGLLSPEQAATLAAENDENMLIVLESGILSDEQIQALIANADEGQREILAAFFGEEFVAGVEANLAKIDAASFEGLKSLVAQGFIAGQDLVNAVADGLASGRLSVQQAMELIGGDLASISDENAIAILNTYEQLGQDLADAYISGDEVAIAAAQEAWDEFMVYLQTIADASGMSVDEIIANFGKLEAAANATAASFSGASMSMGGSARDGASGLNELEQAIRDADEAARDAAAAPIIQAWKDGLITLEQAEAQLNALESAIDGTSQSTRDFGSALNETMEDINRSQGKIASLIDEIADLREKLNPSPPLSAAEQRAADEKRLAFLEAELQRERERVELLNSPEYARAQQMGRAWFKRPVNTWDEEGGAPLTAKAFAAGAEVGGAFDTGMRGLFYSDYQTFLDDYFGGDTKNFGKAGFEMGTDLVKGWYEAIRNGTNEKNLEDWLIGPSDMERLAREKIDKSIGKGLEGTIKSTGPGRTTYWGSPADRAVDQLGAVKGNADNGFWVQGDNGVWKVATAKQLKQIEAMNGTISTALKDPKVANEWQLTGNDLVDGLTQGILDGKAGAIDAAILVAREALNAVKDDLDIRSPSGVFRRDIGHDGIGEGWRLGMVDSLPDLLRTASMMADELGSGWASQLERWTAFELVADLSRVSLPFRDDISILGDTLMQMNEVLAASAKLTSFGVKSTMSGGGGRVSTSQKTNVTLSPASVEDLARRLELGAERGTSAGFTSAMPAVASGVTRHQVQSSRLLTPLVGGS